MKKFAQLGQRIMCLFLVMVFVTGDAEQPSHILCGGRRGYNCHYAILSGSALPPSKWTCR